MTDEELLVKFNQWADELITIHEEYQPHATELYGEYLEGKISALTAAKNYLAKLVRENQEEVLCQK